MTWRFTPCQNHYVLNQAGALQSISGDIDRYLGGGGSIPFRLVVTQAEYNSAQFTSQLAAYRQWLATNLASTQTFTLTFGASSGGLTVGGWQNLQIEIVNSNRQSASAATRLAVRSAACSR